MKSICLITVLVTLAAANPLNWLDQIILDGANFINNARNSINYGIDKSLDGLGTAGQDAIVGTAKGIYDVANAVGHAAPALRPITNNVDRLDMDGAEIGDKILRAAARVAQKVGTGATGLTADAADDVAKLILPKSVAA